MSQTENSKYALTHAAQADMLRRLALYWDGQWFLKTVEEFGLDAGLRINARVRASFGKIEMRSILKALHKKKADDLPDALDILEAYLQVFMGDRLRATFSLLSKDQAIVNVTHCPAFEGGKRAALERIDQSCVACEGLWPTWLTSLLPSQDIRLEVAQTQGRGDLLCEFRISIQGGSPNPSTEETPRP